MRYKILPILLSLIFLLSACAAPAEPATLKIAVLPIIDTLPMYVAQQEGLFAQYGVNVEFVPVASAPERDQLLAAGQADGAINETLAVMNFNKEAVQMQAVRYALVPTEGHGHFFILASGKSGITTARPHERVADLACSRSSWKNSVKARKQVLRCWAMALLSETTWRVADLIERQTGQKFHPGHVWRILRSLGWSCQRPVGRATKRDERAIQRWKRVRWPEIKKKRSSSVEP